MDKVHLLTGVQYVAVNEAVLVIAVLAPVISIGTPANDRDVILAPRTNKLTTCPLYGVPVIVMFIPDVTLM
jgi:hypothetical protein